ncbi:MAG: hypothetical protein ACJAV6_000076 [Candidatus Paceibacteria bacterium]|jgi:hypothetical protein
MTLISKECRKFKNESVDTKKETEDTEEFVPVAHEVQKPKAGSRFS